MCRQTILNHLRNCTHTLIQKYENNRFELVTDDKTTVELCSIIEAIFLHEYIEGNRLDLLRYISPTSTLRGKASFWTFIKAVLPSQLTENALYTSHERTHVGCCRVWIRLCLNEGNLHNYINLFIHESRKIKRFYGSSALMRDLSFLREVIGFLEMLEELRFKLDLSSSLLNTWDTSFSLDLLGFSVQNSSPFYVAEDHNVSTDAYDELSRSSASNSDLSLITNDEWMSPKARMIERPIPMWQEELRLGIESSLDISSSIKDETNQSPSSSGSKVGNSSSLKSKSVRLVVAPNEDPKMIYPLGSNNLLRKACLTWVKPFQMTFLESNSDDFGPEGISTEQVLSVSSKPPGNENSWCVVGEDLLLTPTEEDISRLVGLFPGNSKFDYKNGKNSVYHGLCFRCKTVMKPGSSFLDSYDNCFYCMRCHQLQVCMIPRDIIFNWNLSLQPVSQTTRIFLTALYNKPVINVAKLNPVLYVINQNLFKVRQLRRTLSVLRHQITSCDANIALSLNQYSHFYNILGADLFSIADLVLVDSGELEQKLINAIQNIALAHVYGCEYCCKRIRICNICENLNKPIWMHNIATYKNCITAGCSNVMHTACLTLSRAELLTVPTASPQLASLFTTCFQTGNCVNDRGNMKYQDIICKYCRRYANIVKNHDFVVGHFADPFIP